MSNKAYLATVLPPPKPPPRTCVLLKKIGHAPEFSKAIQKTKQNITARSTAIFLAIFCTTQKSTIRTWAWLFAEQTKRMSVGCILLYILTKTINMDKWPIPVQLWQPITHEYTVHVQYFANTDIPCTFLEINKTQVNGVCRISCTLQKERAKNS